MISTILDSTSLETRAAVFSALGDPIRVRILDVLAEGERCVCDLQQAIEIAPNLLSYHLRVLREVALVEASRRGRWVDYRIGSGARQLLREALPRSFALEPPS